MIEKWSEEEYRQKQAKSRSVGQTARRRRDREEVRKEMPLEKVKELAKQGLKRYEAAAVIGVSDGSLKQRLRRLYGVAYKELKHA